MNFHLSDTALPILKVMVINPLVRSSRLLIAKILSGTVFGMNQLIDVTLLVYSNEKAKANDFKLELISCAFQCIHSVIISSELPSITDADVFCFITNFSNPNTLDFNRIDVDEPFDSLYLIIKIANNFARTLTIVEDHLEDDDVKNNTMKQMKKPHKPIIVADGLVAIDILKSLAKNIPYDVFYCPSPHIAAAKSILGQYLKVQCNIINTALVWAANDEVFHVEIEKPAVITDNSDQATRCDWDFISDNLFSSVVPDHTQFSPSWMKKEFIEKVAQNVKKNPYGGIYKAVEISRILRVIWKSRTNEAEIKPCHSMGVISDGSLETIKGCPYILPVVLSGGSWTAYKRFAYDAHVRQEIKRINVSVEQQHKKLVPYCKKFLEDNIINQAFVSADDESDSIYSTLDQASQLI